MINPAQKTKLLIVEDNASLQQMLTWEFEDMGYQVVAVPTCAGALQTMREQQFDLALLDFNLPDGSGTELMTQMLAEQPNLPVILCSGRIPPQCLEKGAYCFAPKPVSAKSLHQLFQKALNPATHA